MTTNIRIRAAASRRALIGALACGGASSLPMPAIAQGARPIRWRMVTSWTKGLPGPGTSAARLAERVKALTDGRLVLDLFSAGEIVPAFAVHEAVANGTVEAAHTAAFFFQTRLPAAAFFTTVPFGMGPVEHHGWLESGGQELWDRLYAQAGLKAFVAGNTGPSLSGWFRKPIMSAEDVRGLRIRVSGLGGEVYRRLGAVPQAIPPGDVYVSLERGTIDAVELLGPMNDQPLGLHKVAPHSFYPGFNKPNGASELVVSRAAYEALPADLKAALAHACSAEHGVALAEAALANGEALKTLIREGATFEKVPADLWRAARNAADEIMGELAASSALAGEIRRSYQAAQQTSAAWKGITG